MSKSEYFEKLKHPKWQKKRLEILELCEWSCFLCGSKEDTLHVHHIYYEFGNDPWDYPNDALIALCEGCHSYEHSCKDSIDKYVKIAVKDNSILYADIVAFLKVLRKNMGSRTHRKIGWLFALLIDSDFFDMCEETHIELGANYGEDYTKAFIEKLNEKYQSN